MPTESEFSILARFFESEGYPTVIADPRDLEYRNGTLEAAGARVDILYKRVIIHEFLATCDDSHPLLRAYADRAVCLVNSFRAKLVHKKASFAVLTDPAFEGLFTAEQLAVIREHVPWTRVVQAYVPAHRESIPLFEDGRVISRDLTIDFDPFLFNNSAEGGLVRLSSTALSNISSGGAETALGVLP